MRHFKTLKVYFQSREVQKDLSAALSGRFCQQIMYGSCALIHFLMIFVFYGYGVDVMMYYNIASTAFFSGSFIAVTFYKKKTLSLVDIALGEIMVFSFCATVATGWECGFALYLFCCIPAPFFMPNERLSTSIFTSAMISVGFIWLKIYTSDPSVLTHAIESDKQQTQIYLFNSSMTFAMIIFMAVMFVISNRMDSKFMNEKTEEMRQLASIDPLTELFNRRAMTEYIRKVHESAADSGRTYAVAIGDIDNFKRINDKYGHSTGDEVLKAVSKTITLQIPSEGYICRWGGEEILYIIPNCRKEKADIISEQIRRDINAMRFTSNGVEFSISMTFGLVMADLEKDYEASINLADDYLYYGKKNGKNIVIDKEKYTVTP